MKNKILLAASLLIMSVFVGCRKPLEKAKMPYDRPLPPGVSALRKITNPLEIPDFSMACLDLTNSTGRLTVLREAISNSLNYLSKPSSRRFFPCGEITHSRAVDSLQVFAELLDAGYIGGQLNQAIREKFDVYMSVGCDDKGTVLFTGYYTPIFDGSFTRSERFQYPLYEMPDDLVKDSSGNILGQRGVDGQIQPYPSREVIESSQMLQGKELVWLTDPFEAYTAHVQGSTKVKLPSGELASVGYAANNGHEYRSVGNELVKDGKIAADKLSLSAMIEYFKRHKDQISMYINRNPRFVFFQKEDGPPRGCLNEPVKAYRSIATDKSIFPRACLTFISTSLPREFGGRIETQLYSGFALDQDAGGAIRAPGRCDVYMGEGQTAGKLAGHTYKEGRLYYLFLKSPM
jgi:membrane-bound lytic murein transglycosylase A